MKRIIKVWCSTCDHQWSMHVDKAEAYDRVATVTCRACGTEGRVFVDIKDMLTVQKDGNDV